MTKMSQRMKGIFEKRRAVAMHTATRDGVPNVVTVTAEKVIDNETILNRINL
jgi:predicted pyridoxine 5'-phosphate oxidase superfamily flavin-nucleotide-binding protein